jgi:hypothetical protein
LESSLGTCGTLRGIAKRRDKTGEAGFTAGGGNDIIVAAGTLSDSGVEESREHSEKKDHGGNFRVGGANKQTQKGMDYNTNKITHPSRYEIVIVSQKVL